MNWNEHLRLLEIVLYKSLMDRRDLSQARSRIAGEISKALRRPAEDIVDAAWLGL